MTTLVEVRLWGKTVAAVSLEAGTETAIFQFEPEFARTTFELSPICMPLRHNSYTFPSLPFEAFHGLPGLLADSLPDRYGSALIDAWLATQGRTAGSFNAIERLCYIGSRGIGALEFKPAAGPRARQSIPLDVNSLMVFASEMLQTRGNFTASLSSEQSAGMKEILQVGTSAGGARAKAVIAWNPATGEVRSGQVPAPDGFEYWLLKFDGVTDDPHAPLADSQGFGAIEFAYALMAKAAGIRMMDVRLFEEGGRRHFMMRRFDRLPNGDKLHMQSLGALGHFDFNAPGVHSYEQAFQIIRLLGLPMDTMEEQFRRMLFNIVARNQDDHVKNIAFLMDKQGAWALSPAYDMTYSYNPSGRWTAHHQMSMNGKLDNFTMEDIRDCARKISLRRGRADQLLEQVRDAVKQWRRFAGEAKVARVQENLVAANHRLTFPAR